LKERTFWWWRWWLLWRWRWWSCESSSCSCNGSSNHRYYFLSCPYISICFFHL